mmetsp:Transcript_3789/g.14387  ORF Transcript_3789/g.14387 Transcript_3789/m.14387 type:complete len:108 (+) Transcript_3789:1246-1569(+)
MFRRAHSTFRPVIVEKTSGDKYAITTIDGRIVLTTPEFENLKKNVTQIRDEIKEVTSTRASPPDQETTETRPDSSFHGYDLQTPLRAEQEMSGEWRETEDGEAQKNQ